MVDISKRRDDSRYNDMVVFGCFYGNHNGESLFEGCYDDCLKYVESLVLSDFYSINNLLY